MHDIKSNSMIANNVGCMIVNAPHIARYRKPGQFIILRIDEHGERIPLTVADADAARGTITLLYQVVGTTTKKLSRLAAGECLLDIAGPLGHPTEIAAYGRVICIGGGIGVAPLYPIAAALKRAGNKITTIIGARNKDLLILEAELRAVSGELIACTDDGSYGRTGLVTEPLAEMLARESIDLVLAVGPVPMMKTVSDMTRGAGIKTMVSLNSIMIDGTGMCGGCRVSLGGEKRFTCVDGPEFDGHQIDFDELMTRLTTYRGEEGISLERYEHACKIGGGKP